MTGAGGVVLWLMLPGSDDHIEVYEAPESEVGVREQRQDRTLEGDCFDPLACKQFDQPA